MEDYEYGTRPCLMDPYSMQTGEMDTEAAGRPFFVQVFIARRTNAEISIFDKPDATHVLGSVYVSAHLDFDSYLVDDGKVLYHVHWEIHTTAQAGREVVDVKNVSGEPVDHFLDDKLWGDKLLVGFMRLGDQGPEGPIYVNNPTPKTARDKWRK